MTLDRETLARVRDAQLDYFCQWVASDTAREAWCRLVAAAQQQLLAAKLGAILDAAALRRLTDAITDPRTVTATIEPAARAVAADAARRIALRRERAGEIVGEQARLRIDAVVELPDVVSEPLVRAVLTSPAVESAINDMLYEALDRFSRSVNPFVASWGIPALLDALPIVGKGVIKKAIASVQEEFDKRLEPEIRRFLKGFARQTLDRSVKQMLQKGGDPELVELRKQIAAVVLDQPLAELVWSPDREVGKRALAALSESLASVLTHPSTKAELVSFIDRLVAIESQTVADVLAREGIAPTDPRALAEAIWPAFRLVLGSDAVRAELAAIIDASHELLLQSDRRPPTKAQ
jgi:alpha-D-ribose 1-methylphosphonate 5-triphosphate synthase subunit PhnG